MHTQDRNTELRAEIARINGAKSRGPATPEGKAASSKNATKHGLYTRHILLANESPAAYAEFRQAYLDEWQPVGERETDLVHDIINARWRLSRVILMETSAIDCFMSRQAEALQGEFEHVDQGIRTSLAYIGYNGQPVPGMTLLGRAETRFMRIIERSTKMLRELQADRRAATTVAAGPDSPTLPAPGPAKTAGQPERPDAQKKCRNEPSREPVRVPSLHRHTSKIATLHARRHPDAVMPAIIEVPRARHLLFGSRRPRLLAAA